MKSKIQTNERKQSLKREVLFVFLKKFFLPKSEKEQHQQFV